jgi:hypothetical protein
MRTASAYAPQRTSFRSQTRAIEFNDADWEARSFSGDLAQTRTFPLTVDRPAVTTIAWAEAFDDSFGHSVLGGDPDVRRATDGVALRLLDEAGEEVEHTGGPYFGLGTASFALTGLDPGSYTLEVSGLTRTDEPLPFSVHLVTTHGARTLRSMRWRFFQQDNLRLPLIGVCPASLEAVPVSAEVSTFHVDLDWDTHAPGLPGWTVRFGLPGVGEFPCGEAGNGDWIRLTVPGTDVWYFGATPSRDRAFVSAFDTVFEMEVGFEYTPLPPEHP